MGRFVYSMQVSLDGFVETPDHSLDWVIVDEEFHRFVNGQARESVAFVNGRRMYEVLRAWDTVREEQPDLADYMVEFAEIWVAKPKIVFSSTLTEVGAGARLIQTSHVGGALARLKQETDGDLGIGGPMLAGAAIGLDLVDEYRLFVQPAAIGSGTPYFPARQRLDLKLVEEHRFRSGVVYLAYRPKDVDPTRRSS
jgi:dihydrofolate reductase